VSCCGPIAVPGIDGSEDLFRHHEAEHSSSNGAGAKYSRAAFSGEEHHGRRRKRFNTGSEEWGIALHELADGGMILGRVDDQ